MAIIGHACPIKSLLQTFDNRIDHPSSINSQTRLTTQMIRKLIMGGAGREVLIARAWHMNIWK